MEPQVLYSCRETGCAEETSYTEDMLKEHPDGGPICEGCWDYGDRFHECNWSDLPDFISPVAALEARCEEYREALELADAALSGANMNMNVVRNKVKAALSKESG